MPTIGSITKTVRIAPRDLTIIEGLMADGTSWSGAIHKLCEGVPEVQREPKTADRWNIDEADLMDLDSMSRFMGGDVRTMIHLFDEAVNEGVIRYDQGRYVGVEDVELEDLYEICREQNVNPQEVIDKAVKAMRQNGKKPRG